MKAQAIALLVARYGVPLAQSLWSTINDAITNRGEPDDQMWDTLAALESAEDIKARIKAKLEAEGKPTPGPSQ